MNVLFKLSLKEFLSDSHSESFIAIASVKLYVFNPIQRFVHDDISVLVRRQHHSRVLQPALPWPKVSTLLEIKREMFSFNTQLLPSAVLYTLENKAASKAASEAVSIQSKVL